MWVLRTGRRIIGGQRVVAAGEVGDHNDLVGSITIAPYHVGRVCGAKGVVHMVPSDNPLQHRGNHDSARLGGLPATGGGWEVGTAERGKRP
jgi:hypothetical protein